MNEPIRVLLAAPSYDGRFDVCFLESVTNTIFLCAQNNIEVIPVYLCYDSLVQRVRNKYFSIAYENKFDVLFFVDSDIGWRPKDFLKLVLSEKDMIGGGYRKKQDEEELYTFKVLEDKNGNFQITPDKNGLLEVFGLGCGFLKLSKNCVKNLFESEQKYYLSNEGKVKIICDCITNESNHFISEDIVLGYKWKNLGGKVYVDVDIDLIHVGSKKYIGGVDKWLQDWRLKFEQQNKQLAKKQTLDDYIPLEEIKIENLDENMFKVL